MSASLTVGRAPLIALTKSLSTSEGSSNLSDSTSVHDISNAPRSPGEHGVSFSSPLTVTYLNYISPSAYEALQNILPFYNA